MANDTTATGLAGPLSQPAPPRRRCRWSRGTPGVSLRHIGVSLVECSLVEQQGAPAERYLHDQDRWPWSRSRSLFGPLGHDLELTLMRSRVYEFGFVQSTHRIEGGD